MLASLQFFQGTKHFPISRPTTWNVLPSSLSLDYANSLQKCYFFSQKLYFSTSSVYVQSLCFNTKLYCTSYFSVRTCILICNISRLKIHILTDGNRISLRIEKPTLSIICRYRFRGGSCNSESMDVFRSPNEKKGGQAPWKNKRICLLFIVFYCGETEWLVGCLLVSEQW